MNLDDTDMKILKTLQKRGRIRNTELSKIVNLSTTPCLERVKRLEREGYIEGYYAKINREKLGFDFLVYMEITLEPNTTEVFNNFKRQIENIDEIQECNLLIGGYDYLLKICLKDRKSYMAFLGDIISRLPNIKTTRTYFSVEEVKTSNGLNLSLSHELPVERMI